MLFYNMEAPVLMDVEAGGQGGSDVGQVAVGTETTPDVSVDTPVVPDVAAPAEEPFLIYDRHEDPKYHKTFTTKDEALDYIHNGTLRFDDYTRKTQELAEERKKHESDRAKFDAEYTAFLPQKTEYDKISEFLGSLPDAERKALEGRIRSSRIDPQTKEALDRVKKLEEAEKQREKDRQKEEALRKSKELEDKANSFLLQRYPDYDVTSIDSELQRFREIPETEQITALRELIYKALAFGGAKPTVTKPHQSGTTGTVPSKQAKFKTPDEAAAAAKEALGIQGD